jgi:hypothetical protein
MSSANLPPSESSTTDRRQTETEYRERIAAIDRAELEKSRKLFALGEANTAEMLQKAKKRSAADRSFAEAAEFAKRSMKSDELIGEVLPHYQERYTVAQGLKAAVHGREDGIAALVLQRDILVRLDAIKSVLWILVGLMVFVAYKVA